jgi:methylmalonyl-CoA/ethylmalonyl-CoA epimerase
MNPDGPDPGMILTSIDHVGIAVADLQAGIDFHTVVLGLRLTHREDNHEYQVSEAMLETAAPSGQSAVVQLLAPLSESSPLARFLARTGAGIQHLAFRVSDVERATAEYRRRGLRLLYDAPKPGTRGSRINFIHPKDAGGVLIELVEVARRPDQG